VQCLVALPLVGKAGTGLGLRGNLAMMRPLLEGFGLAVGVSGGEQITHNRVSDDSVANAGPSRAKTVRWARTPLDWRAEKKVGAGPYSKSGRWK
jgi:hypothetical protein